ncbi:MAG: ATP-binding protein [Deltaproteobacteria bacterium]|nr:ATP-binding protein [Deltaproteobacteria bacterium]
MNTNFKKLTTDFTPFRTLIEEDYVYVDKTGLLRELILGSHKNMFLSRPRGFGKSLVLDTVAEIFSGNASLFEGLQIQKLGYDFPQYPVLRFDMSLASSSPEELKRALMGSLNLLADENNLTLKSKDHNNALKELINKTRKKHQKDVVILIDEYDYPVSSALPDKVLAEKNTKVLANFYVGLKSVSSLLRCALVTGATCYEMTGISSGLNNLYDISFDKKYAAICGFTPEEMDHYFGDCYPAILQTLSKDNYLATTKSGSQVLSTAADLKKEMLKWYDGYSWDGLTKVLNPISIINFLDIHTFGRFWKLTGASENLLMNIFENLSFELTFDKLEDVPLEGLAKLNPGDVKAVPFLFQTGYLTIDKRYYKNSVECFSLKVPNFELKNEFYTNFSKNLFKILVKDTEKIQEAIKLETAFLKRDAEALSKIIAALYAELPDVLQPPRAYQDSADEHGRAPRESFYHSLLWVYCKVSLEDARAEEPGSKGTPDLTLTLNDQTYVIVELKYAKDVGQDNVEAVLNTRAKEALKAIKDKKYGQHYHLKGQKALTVGVGVFGRGEVKVIFGDD